LPYFSRAASLNGYAEVTRELGLAPHKLVREAGLPAACLSQPDLKIPTARAIALFELTAERAGAPDLGLRIAEARPFSTLGAVGLVMREQPTVRKAMEALASHVWAHMEGIALEIEEGDGLAILSPAFARAANGPARQASELAVAVIFRLLRRFLGAAWQPEMIIFDHARPDSLARYVRFFGQAPLFGQDRNAVVLRTEDLDAEIPGADPASARQLTRYLEFVAGSRDADYAARVREAIHLLLPRGECRVDRVARYFGVDRRTVHRKLALEGTSFDALVQQARTELARAYLSAKDRSLTEVADLLGFSCLSAFSRWRRRTMRSASPAGQPSVRLTPRKHGKVAQLSR
jgi:AraC-like DNA-binding protein